MRILFLLSQGHAKETDIANICTPLILCISGQTHQGNVVGKCETEKLLQKSFIAGNNEAIC